MCTKCRHVFKVHADFDQFYTFSAPVSCPNPSGCNSMKFSSLSEGSEPAACRDYQEIKIQEQVQPFTGSSVCTAGYLLPSSYRCRGSLWAASLDLWL